MSRRKDSFARALSDAEKRLEKALAERTRCEFRIVDLNVEIPKLQLIIASLSGKETTPAKVPVLTQSMIPGRIYTDPPPNLSPEELAKWYVDRDLSNVGSVPPAKPVAPSTPVSEDEILADDFAEGKRE